MSHENSYTLHVIEWQRPLLSFQTCNTWSDSCGSHRACSGVNSQVSQSTDEVIFWQGAVATEPSGPQWGTGHPTFPPITHFPILSFPILSFQLFILKEKSHPKLWSFASSSIFSFFFLETEIWHLLVPDSVIATVGWIYIFDHSFRNRICGNRTCKTCFVTLSS